MEVNPRDGAWRPPGELERRAALALLKPLELAVDAQLFGAERIPKDRPLLFVGNHQLLALDTVFLIASVWRARGILLRGLADDLIFKLPLLRELAQRFGIVRATRDNCDALLDAGECVLVYPGGAREAGKGQQQAYQLGWWDRLGFARMALAHRATIVPVAATGLDSSVRIVLERDDYLSGPLRPVIDLLRVRHDLLPPVPLPAHRPHIHFHVAEPIPIDPLWLHDEEKAAHTLRSRVAEAIEAKLALRR
ncbi:MAG: lysophospholipid acyltransferase family protein [Myxococcales bacterium]|nr:lysophospholipid acyltransferase family protein [Myxococcales bacterium]